MADSNPYRRKHRYYRLEEDHVDFNFDKALAPAGTPLPEHVCGQCAHYIKGGYCGRDGRRDVGFLWDACRHFTTEKQETTMETQKTIPATKVCKRCGRELPAEAFGRHARSGDGLQPYCKECQSNLEKGKPRSGRPRKNGIASIPAAHAQEVRKFVVEHVSMSKKKDTPVTANPSVEEIPDHDLAKELRRRGYDVKCTKIVEL